jgi:hypothetical protein
MVKLMDFLYLEKIVILIITKNSNSSRRTFKSTKDLLIDSINIGTGSTNFQIDLQRYSSHGRKKNFNSFFGRKHLRRFEEKIQS